MRKLSFYYTFIFWFIILSPHCFSQDIHPPNQLQISLEDNEYWWGAVVDDGYLQPFTSKSNYSHNLYGDNKANQIQPFLLSNRGQYIWCEDPFEFNFKNGVLSVTSDSSRIVYEKFTNNLRAAFQHASQNFFPPSGELPAALLFQQPQYNTWIELTYNQNQKDILEYARGIVNNGFPPGVLMIDDTWQKDYGAWEFSPDKFPDPEGMMDELHDLGFKVMLWVCPFVSPDSPVFRVLREKGALIKNAKTSKPAIIEWWNGYSTMLDMTHPEAVEWFTEKLTLLQKKYNVAGFKFDGGDAYFYTGDIESYVATHANGHMQAWARFGLTFPYNEYRACWKLAGEALAQRLHDKNHNWEDLRQLIPNILLQGLIGYAYTCPDMIGGGEYKSFLNLENVDQELIVRSAQCQALMPMMQFSVAPWRVLEPDKVDMCREMAMLHSRFGEHIISLAKSSAKTGEPIIRSLEYMYPHQGYATIDDQFMLGEDILVAPVLEKGARSRVVEFPPGNWKDEEGETYRGPKRIAVDAPLDKLPWFRKDEK